MEKEVKENKKKGLKSKKPKKGISKNIENDDNIEKDA